tara:strand:+ start:5009 stop:5404 length:396 start_codon:yes stop_codon:yes gene_type:complete
LEQLSNLIQLNLKRNNFPNVRRKVMKGGMEQLMKQAQQMQENMQKTQKELADLTVLGESGGGLVKLTMTCKHQVKSIEIDDDLLGDDKDMLEDLIIASFNDAVRKVESTIQKKYSGMASGIPMPPGMKFPF